MTLTAVHVPRDGPFLILICSNAEPSGNRLSPIEVTPPCGEELFSQEQPLAVGSKLSRVSCVMLSSGHCLLCSESQPQVTLIWDGSAGFLLSTRGQTTFLVLLGPSCPVRVRPIHLEEGRGLERVQGSPRQ